MSMTLNKDEQVLLRAVSVLYHAAAVELLIREYHWRGVAAERFAGLMAAGVVSQVEQFMTRRQERDEQAGETAVSSATDGEAP